MANMKPRGRPSACWCCLLMLMAMALATVLGQIPQYWDDQAVGTRIDNVTRKSIRLMLNWRNQFLSLINSTRSDWDRLEEMLNTDYSSSNVFNMTTYTLQKLLPVYQRLENVTALLDSLNMTKSDVFYGFLKGPQGKLDMGGAYNGSNRASGTFTAPLAGLYRVMVKTDIFSDIDLHIMRNGNETLSSLTMSNHFDVKTRIRLVWLNTNDEIFCTGSVPSNFGVWLLRKQELAPRFFP